MVEDVFRCCRGRWCTARQPRRDPVTNDHIGWDGAGVVEAGTLCEHCAGAIEDALIHLPLDVAELTSELGKPLSHAAEEQTAHAKPGPTLPILVDREALRALIVHETWGWATAVARELGEALDQELADRSRDGYRVTVACLVLRAHLPRFLALGPTEHRARSLGIRRTEGHDDESTTRYGDDYWTVRDGAAGALLLRRLHERAWATARRHQAPMPVFAKCPDCRQLTLRRFPGHEHATCMNEACKHEVAVEFLDILRQAAANCRTPADVATLSAALNYTPPAPDEVAS